MSAQTQGAGLDPASVDADLTICSVSYNSAAHLAFNRRLVAHLNPGARIRWIVVENSPPDAEWQVMPDPSDPDLTLLPPAARNPESLRPGSYQHGKALNEAVRMATTRWVLVLDPDFYIVRPNWHATVTTHMAERGLGYFGAPWHPRWYTKFRYFPSVHCFFVDQQRQRVADLDFSAGEGGVAHPRTWVEKLQIGRTARRLTGPSRQLVDALRSGARLGIGVFDNLRNRARVGIAEETGYRVHAHYRAQGGPPAECVVPAYRRFRDYPGDPPVPGSRALDWLLPERLSYEPKRLETVSFQGFADFGFEDVGARGWEEFFWRGAPFGFHIRGQQRRRLERQGELEALAEILQSLAGLMPPTDSLTPSRLASTRV